jgi:hypothetical protein
MFICTFLGGQTCVYYNTMVRLWWLFFPLLLLIFLFTLGLGMSCHNLKLSSYLFFISNLILILLIAIFFCSNFFLYWFYFSISSLKHLVSFNLYIKFGPHCFDFYLFFILILIEFCFQFYPSTFGFGLFLCEIWSLFFWLLFVLFWIIFLFFFQFHPLTFGWLKILFHDFLKLAFYKVSLELITRVTSFKD